MLDDRFTLLLKELSTLLGVELKPDQNNSCLLNLKDKIKVQIELDPSQENQLILGSVLGELSPGTFREEMLLLALRSNAKPYPRVGDFGYSTNLNSLILFEVLNIDYGSAENVFHVLTPFVHKAFAWKEAIDNTLVSPQLVDMDFAGIQDNNIFGLNG